MKVEVIKSFVCYKSNLNESESEWRKVFEKPEEETQNVNVALGMFLKIDDEKDGSSCHKFINCPNCKVKIAANMHTVQIKCFKCYATFCFTCNNIHEDSELCGDKKKSLAEIERKANERFQWGIKEMKKGNFRKAMMKFSEAIGVVEKTIFYIKRCECLMKMKEYEEAIEEALSLIKFDEKNRVAHYQLIDSYIAIGDTQSAEKAIESFRKVTTVNSIDKIQVPKIEKLKNLREDIVDLNLMNSHEKCLLKISEALKIAESSLELILSKLRCAIILMRNSDAIRANDMLCRILKQDFNFFNAIKLYYDGKIEGSLKAFKQISSEMKRKIKTFDDILSKVSRLAERISQEGKNADEQIEIYEKCLQIDTSNVSMKKILLIKKGTVYFEQKKSYSMAIRMANGAMNFGGISSRFEALMLRAKSYLALKQYLNCVTDCKLMLELEISESDRTKVEMLRRICETAQNEQDADSDEKSNANEEEVPSKPNDSKYSNNSNEKVDNRNFFSRFHNESSEEPKRDTSTRYSFSATNGNMNFKTYVGQPRTPKTPQKSAEQLKKEAAAEAFNKKGCREQKVSKNFSLAVAFFSSAIALCPKNGVYLCNRAASFMAMDKFELALADAVKSVDSDPGFWKGYSRAINCFLALGDIKHTEDYIEKLQNNVAGVESIKFNEIPKLKSLKEFNENIEKFYGERNFEECLKNLENALKIAKACTPYENLKAECLIMVERYDEAHQIVSKALYANPRDVDMIFIQGLSFYNQGSFKSSIGKFESVLRIDSDHSKAKKLRRNAETIQEKVDEGLDHFKSNQFYEALESFTSALKIDPCNKKLAVTVLYNRGSTYFKVQQFRCAVIDFTEMLKLSEDHAKGLYKRGQAHFKLNEFEDCLIDCEESMKLEQSLETKRLIDDAKFSLRVSKGKTCYEILGIDKTASKDEIKKAFHKMSRLYHSDKHPGATAVDKKKLERKFQEVKQAYNKAMID